MESKTMQSPDIKMPSFGWLTPARKSMALAFVAGAIAGYAGGNGHTTQGAIEHVSDQLGQTKNKLVTVEKHDNCVTKKAQIATAVANTAVQSAIRPDVDVPDTAVIPYCPPAPTVKVK